MKKAALIGLLVISLCGQSVLAVQKQHSITTNVGSLALGLINVEGNYALKENLSATGGLGFSSYDSSDWDYSLLNINIGLRYYWTKKAVNGWYISPFLGFTNINAEYTEPITEITADATASSINYGGLVGYQSIWNNGVTFDLGFGMQMITIPSIDVTVGGTTKTGDEISATLPIIKLSLGYAF
ncbi:MAG: DUF3575 domain-containing protein [Elusimicrobiota bacterium]